MSRSGYSEYSLAELKDIVWEYCLSRKGTKIPLDIYEKAEWLDEMSDDWMFRYGIDPYLKLGLAALCNEAVSEIEIDNLRRS